MKLRPSRDRWLYFPVLLLADTFLFRLLNQSKMLWQFPLDMVNDVSSYMAQLYFLDTCDDLRQSTTKGIFCLYTR